MMDYLVSIIIYPETPQPGCHIPQQLFQKLPLPRLLIVCSMVMSIALLVPFMALK